MVTLLTTILAIFFTASSCTILIRDFFNIVVALTSNVKFSGHKVEKENNVTLRHAYALR